MKQTNKKLLGITAIGLSAWLLVIALVIFDNTTIAMLINNPAPAEQTTTADNANQPRTLGVATDVTHAPVATLAREDHTDATSNEIAQAMNTKKTTSILPFALAGATLLVAASVIAGFVVLRKRSTT